MGVVFFVAAWLAGWPCGVLDRADFQNGLSRMAGVPPFSSEVRGDFGRAIKHDRVTVD